MSNVGAGGRRRAWLPMGPRRAKAHKLLFLSTTTSPLSVLPVLFALPLLVSAVHVYAPLTTRTLPTSRLMTLPASDAFSLSHDPTRPPYSLSLRPTSPKIPFVSAHSRTTTSTAYNIPPRKTVRSLSRRSMSNGHAAAHEPSEAAQATATTPRVDVSRRASRKHSVTTVKSSSPPAPPVDWEIPRKILHSSIGGCTGSTLC